MNEFEITEDNRPFLEARGKIVLNACPGSGKTTAIAYKLTKLIDECTRYHGEFAGIACLSFTNVAKAEISAKFQGLTSRQLTFPNAVLTIDSFINQYITLPFYYLAKKAVRRPVILDVVSFLDNMNWGIYRASNDSLLSKVLKPSKIKQEQDGSYSWNGHIPKSSTVATNVFKEYAKRVKTWQWENGYLDNDDSTFIAYRLLTTYPEIARSLVARFPYIIVDEAQDTSEIQYTIFDMLVEAGLKNLEYVGDPYQSLYEFREARPDLFLKRFRDTDNWQSLSLKNCRRTSQQIINIYSLFRDATEAPIVSTCKHSTDHQLKVFRYDTNDLTNLINRYESVVDPQKDNHILVRGTSHLEMFGAKPPSQDHWKNGAAKTLVEAQIQYIAGNSKLAVDMLRMFLAEIELPRASHHDQRAHRESLKGDTDLNIELFDFLRGMPAINDTLRDWSDKVTAYINERDCKSNCVTS